MIKHMAEVQETLCKIIADKYGHDVEEMMQAVVGDPRWYAIEQPDLLKEIDEFAPKVTQAPAPAVSKPVVNKPVVSKPVVSKPVVSEPAVPQAVENAQPIKVKRKYVKVKKQGEDSVMSR